MQIAASITFGLFDTAGMWIAGASGRFSRSSATTLVNRSSIASSPLIAWAWSLRIVSLSPTSLQAATIFATRSRSALIASSRIPASASAVTGAVATASAFVGTTGSPSSASAS